jgi:hypothetical protein
MHWMADPLMAHTHRLFGVSVRFHAETEAEADNRTLLFAKPRTEPKTEQTKTLVRFGSVRFGYRFLA